MSLALGLQLWGGVLYTFNKIFFLLAELAKSERDLVRNKKWRVRSWVLCIIGLPAWMILLAMKRDWILLAIELGGLPAMMLGVYYALKREDEKVPQWAESLAIGSCFLGLAGSIYDFGGLKNIQQFLEGSTAVTFLVGTYYLAHDRYGGYLWYLGMHASMIALMTIQSYPALAAQQIFSFCVITFAYRVARGTALQLRLVPSPDRFDVARERRDS